MLPQHHDDEPAALVKNRAAAQLLDELLSAEVTLVDVELFPAVERPLLFSLDQLAVGTLRSVNDDQLRRDSVRFDQEPLAFRILKVP